MSGNAVIPPAADAAGLAGKLGIRLATGADHEALTQLWRRSVEAHQVGVGLPGRHLPVDAVDRLLQLGLQGAEQVLRQRVEGVGAIQGQRGQAVGTVVAQDEGFGLAHGYLSPVLVAVIKHAD